MGPVFSRLACFSLSVHCSVGGNVQLQARVSKCVIYKPYQGKMADHVVIGMITFGKVAQLPLLVLFSSLCSFGILVFFLTRSEAESSPKAVAAVSTATTSPKIARELSQKTEPATRPRSRTPSKGRGRKKEVVERVKG